MGHHASVDAVVALDVVGTAITVGDRVPEFILPDVTGEPMRLSHLLAAGPVVVSFYRGGWCSSCNLELHVLQPAPPALTATGGPLAMWARNRGTTTEVLPILTTFVIGADASGLPWRARVMAPRSS